GEGNIAVSPASIDACVLVALAGARGQTAAQIAQALRLGEQEARDPGMLLQRAAARLRSPAAASGPVPPGKRAPASEPPMTKLAIANSAWVQRGFPIHEAYRTLLSTKARATFETVDFAGATEAARRAINDWVDKQTEHKISQLLAPS